MPPLELGPGWSRNPDGYVRTGQLALYRPSAALSDYRLEFFGQIESKSIGWVVRARDMQNYYAMKFMWWNPAAPHHRHVHYPVVGGRRGTRWNAALRHGARQHAIPCGGGGEGQPRDHFHRRSGSGSVDGRHAGKRRRGFFSEPGERARLYWMKLVTNDDLLGRICAYLSGGSEEGSDTTARWRRMESPAGMPQPLPGGVPLGRAEDAVLQRPEPVHRISGTGGFNYGVSAGTQPDDLLSLPPA